MAQHLRHIRHGALPLLLNRAGHGVQRIAGVEHTVDDQTLVRKTQALQFLAGARRLKKGADFGAGDEFHAGQLGFAQGGQGLVESSLLHL
jgi:hypothetical protein